MTLYYRRISALRRLLKKNKIDAYLVPSTDEHQNEYTPEYAMRRQWISGFTGSFGDVIITADKSFLWTDSRYFLQAEIELEGSEMELLKAGVLNYTDIYDWASSNLAPGSVLGVDPALISYEDAMSVRAGFLVKQQRLKFIDQNLVDLIRDDDPRTEAQPVEIHSVKYCGEDYRIKLSRLREKMKQAGCTIHPIGSLDSICWLLNIRGKDIPFNPLVISQLVVTAERALLFMDLQKLSDEALAHFKGTVDVYPYEDFAKIVRKSCSAKDKVWIDPKRTNYKTASFFTKHCRAYSNESPVYYFKAVKNAYEIASMRDSMIADGIAMVKFLHWMENNVQSGNVTEESASAKLEEYRRESKEYRGPSFHTISAFNEHGAIVHYSYTHESSLNIKSPGLYLVDSGAHYPGGTTDITRTIAIGSATDEQKELYTRVLKGHIQLALSVFPKGTKGVQLDTLARKPLWDKGFDYGHGTGHGVGFYLNVHEGPHSISPSKLSSPSLEPGMLVTDEPGYYKKGEYGIRIENILLVDLHPRYLFEGMQFYRFKTLTLCPYEPNLIDSTLLSSDEVSFINAYHKKVFEALSPGIKDRILVEWLKEKTKPFENGFTGSSADISYLF